MGSWLWINERDVNNELTCVASYDVPYAGGHDFTLISEVGFVVKEIISTKIFDSVWVKTECDKFIMLSSRMLQRKIARID